jgi:hypothetical protein
MTPNPLAEPVYSRLDSRNVDRHATARGRLTRNTTGPVTL